MSLLVRSLSDRVYEILRRRIVMGEIAPGEAIKQDTLASEFGVSKVPLREALARLDEGNLVVLNTNKGFMAPPLSLEEADDIFALRLTLEPSIAAATSERAPPSGKDEVTSALRALSAADGDLGESMSAKRRITAAMLTQADRPTVTKLVLQLFDRAERYYHGRALSEIIDAPSLQRLASAWLAGDAERVRELYTLRLQLRADGARRAVVGEPAPTHARRPLLQTAL